MYFLFLPGLPGSHTHTNQPYFLIRFISPSHEELFLEWSPLVPSFLVVLLGRFAVVRTKGYLYLQVGQLAYRWHLDARSFGHDDDARYAGGN